MNKKGFTLIELLIVVVIIGILAAIAIPRFGETRERAFRSAVTSDLRNVQTLQEQFYFDNDYTYATGLSAAGGENEIAFTTSDGVTIAITGADASGYVATGTHSGWPGNSCVLTVTSAGSSEMDCGEAGAD
jgi:type IV pilus assembly protein PilA